MGLSLRQKEEEEGRWSAPPPHTPQPHGFPQGARTAQAAAQRSSPPLGPLRPAAAAAEDGGEGGGGDDGGGGGGGYGQRRGPASRRRRPPPSAPRRHFVSASGPRPRGSARAARGGNGPGLRGAAPGGFSVGLAHGVRGEGEGEGLAAFPTPLRIVWSRGWPVLSATASLRGFVCAFPTKPSSSRCKIRRVVLWRTPKIKCEENPSAHTTAVPGDGRCCCPKSCSAALGALSPFLC